MKFPFPFKNTQTPTSSWPWPSCGNTKTLSFRAGNDLFKTINSAYIDATVNDVVKRDEGSWFSGESPGSDEETETVVRGLRSERLFFEPGESSSILEEAKTDGFPFKESVVMAMESRDPYLDFKRSMEEMVEAHGLKDWECLEELLSWYLKANSKSKHGYILGAFVDMLIGLAMASSFSFSSDDNSSPSPTSPSSFSSSTSSTSPCLSSLEIEDERM
ncbi:hypothetical protein F0562_015955 [Nyssa sinensis]|uniref:Transcription repressor n=1 Tax=Nyssa sinensis TaxID=561372 RepID=A0A5J4ZN35_9ASTE|nr:hypothetical protein F0562_015955 [Nyssa sinensis]